MQCSSLAPSMRLISPSVPVHDSSSLFLFFLSLSLSLRSPQSLVLNTCNSCLTLFIPCSRSLQPACYAAVLSFTYCHNLSSSTVEFPSPKSIMESESSAPLYYFVEKTFSLVSFEKVFICSCSAAKFRFTSLM